MSGYANPPRPARNEALPTFVSRSGAEFDAATIASTARLADSSLWVTAQGTFRVERIPSTAGGRPHARDAADGSRDFYAGGGGGERRTEGYLAPSSPPSQWLEPRRRPVGEQPSPAEGGGFVPSPMTGTASPARNVSTRSDAAVSDVDGVTAGVEALAFGSYPFNPYDTRRRFEPAPEPALPGVVLPPEHRPAAPGPYPPALRVVTPNAGPSYNGPEYASHGQHHGRHPQQGVPQQPPPHPYEPYQPYPQQQQPYPPYQQPPYHLQHHQQQYQQPQYYQPYPYPWPPQQPLPQQPSRQSLGVTSTGSSAPSLRDLPTPSSRATSGLFSPIDGGHHFPVMGPTAEEKEQQPQYDLLTPVVVEPASPRLGPRGNEPHSQSDATSLSREHVRPYEEVAYEGNVLALQTLKGPAEQAWLKVFRNTLSQELRFYTRTGSSSDTWRIKGEHAELVPMYAYTQGSELLVYIRDTSTASGSNSSTTLPGGPSSTAGAAGGGNSQPSGTYQFPTQQELFQFQAKLTGEDVVLDISMVKTAQLARATPRAVVEKYHNARVQLWHEPRSRRSTQSDGASFVTAGTALSGPIRERVVANGSRLMLFLGRADEFLTVPVTDDVELKPVGATLVKMRARKYGFGKRSSKSGVEAQLNTKRNSEPAGLSIDGRPFNPNRETSFQSYKQFDLDFENEQSQLDFVQAWNEVIVARRKQREMMGRIQEGMRTEVFTAKEALQIRI